MAWIYLVLAGVFEAGFAISLKLMDGHKNIYWAILFYISMASSLFLLSLAIRTIPISIAYAVWTGIGTALVAIIGFVFLHEPASIAKICFLLLLIIAIIGLKFTSN